MKGSPKEPQCGFSRRISALLNDQNIQFAHFDILRDEAVRVQQKPMYRMEPT